MFALLILLESVTTCEWGTGQFYLDIEARMMHTETELLGSFVYPLQRSPLSLGTRFFFRLYWYISVVTLLIPSEVLCIPVWLRYELYRSSLKEQILWMDMFSISADFFTHSKIYQPDTHHYATHTHMAMLLTAMDNEVFPVQSSQQGQTCVDSISLTIWIRPPNKTMPRDFLKGKLICPSEITCLW